MSTTTLISLIVVVVAFALFFYLSFKGVNLFLTVFACTLLVSFCTPDGITSIFTAFLPSVGTMFQQFLLLYTIGGAFGFCLMESGLGSAMATHMIKVFGEKWIAVALFVITCLMMAAGAGSVAYGTLVGMPNALNIAPTTYLGTTTMAGVGISLVCTAFSVVFIVVYLIMLTNRLKKKGEGFVSYTDDPQNDEDESKLPPAWKGYLCVAAIIGLSLLFQKLGITALQATTYAQVLSIVLVFVLVGPKYLPHVFQTCVRGIQGSLIPVVFISIVVGYGTVVQATPVFTLLVEKVLSMNMHPYLLTFVAVNLLSGLCANGTGGVTLFMKNFGDSILANPSINLGALHRIAAISGAGFDSLPHNGAIAFQLSVFKLSYKEGYFQQFMMSVVVNLLAGIIAVVMAMLLY